MAQYPPPERVGSGRSLSRCQHQPSLRFREKRLASQPPPSRRAQALKSPPNRVFYEFSLRAEETYWDAYATHTARSEVIHGGVSPTSAVFLKILRSAHDLTRNALFRGLEVHCLLDDRREISSLASLREFFAKQQSKRAAVLKRLDNELKARTKGQPRKRVI